MKKIKVTILICLIVITNLTAQKNEKIHLLNTFHIASNGGWDYIAFCSINQYLYVSHGNQVNIIDSKTGDSVSVIPNTLGVHGIAFNEATGKGFITNGKTNTVTVFDIKTNQVTAQIPVGERPDAIIYEPYNKKIIVCNAKSNDINIIEPLNNQVIATIKLNGNPEMAVSDEAGKLFVNIESGNSIAVIDLKENKVLNYISLLPAEGPTGLAYDKANQYLFAGCEKVLMVVDAKNGKIVDKLSIGKGCDGVAFDAEEKNIYASCGEGTLAIIHEKNKNKFTAENVNTQKSARTIALDNITHRIYLPAAKFEEADPTKKERPKMLSGTFSVLVFGK